MESRVWRAVTRDMEKQSNIPFGIKYISFESCDQYGSGGGIFIRCVEELEEIFVNLWLSTNFGTWA
jgi:hypothetical protein